MKLRACRLCAALMLLLFAARAAAQTIDAEVLPAELSVREMTALSESAFAIANESVGGLSPFGIGIAVWPYVKLQSTCQVFFLYLDGKRAIHTVGYNNYTKLMFYQGKHWEWYGGVCDGGDAIANGAKAMDACRTLILHVAGLLVREKGATRNDALDFNYRLTYSPESDCTWLVEMGFGPDNHVRYRIDRSGAISGVE